MKKHFVKKVILVLTIPVAFIGLFMAQNYFEDLNLVKAQSNNKYELFGHAWSSNIGWVSFNSKNHSGGVEYRVEADKNSGELSGYAWSSNIGWVSFNKNDIGTPPSTIIRPPDGGEYMYNEYLNKLIFAFNPTCKADESALAKIDFNTGNVSGWARACSVFQQGCSGTLKSNAYRGGWDGWIKFDSTNSIKSNYRVKLIEETDEFENWAWGSDNIGWLSFNCKNQNVCSQSNYAVSLLSSSNVKDFDITFKECDFNSRLGIKKQGEVQGGMTFRVEFDYSGEEQNNRYQLKISGITDPSYEYTTPEFYFSGGKVDGAIINEDNFFHDNEQNRDSVRLTWGHKYMVKLEIVNDSFSSEEIEIQLPDHSYPYVTIEKEQETSLIITEYLLDGNKSKVYGGTGANYKWEEVTDPKMGQFSSTDEAVTTITFFGIHGGKSSTVMLTVSEKGNPSYSCSTTESLSIKKKTTLPKYKEISPLVEVPRFLSSIYSSVLKALQ